MSPPLLAWSSPGYLNRRPDDGFRRLRADGDIGVLECRLRERHQRNLLLPWSLSPMRTEVFVAALLLLLIGEETGIELRLAAEACSSY